MFKKILGLLLVINLTACTGVNLDQALGTVLEGMSEGGLTNAQIGNGLKQALEIGIGKGADRLSMKDGYFKSAYKVLLPEEARKLTSRLQNVPGFNQVENKILELVNRGAEDAAKKAAKEAKKAARRAEMGEEEADGTPDPTAAATVSYFE